MIPLMVVLASDVDTSEVVQEKKMNSQNVSSIGMDLTHTWFLSSGCSRHITGLKFLLTKFVEKDGPIVVFSDNSEGIVMGVETFECKTFKRENVFYVKGLKSNLISISQVCDAGYKVIFNCNEGKVIDSKNKIVLIALLDNNIYLL